jgi:hypothetical protein
MVVQVLFGEFIDHGASACHAGSCPRCALPVARRGRQGGLVIGVHLSYVRDKTGHALIGARQWIPAEHIADPVKSLLMGLPLDLQFRTKGQPAIDISTDAAADGIRPDFCCGDEVYGSCIQ